MDFSVFSFMWDTPSPLPLCGTDCREGCTDRSAARRPPLPAPLVLPRPGAAGLPLALASAAEVMASIPLACSDMCSDAAAEAAAPLAASPESSLSASPPESVTTSAGAKAPWLCVPAPLPSPRRRFCSLGGRASASVVGFALLPGCLRFWDKPSDFSPSNFCTPRALAFSGPTSRMSFCSEWRETTEAAFVTDLAAAAAAELAALPRCTLPLAGW
mmetsp:Transcript_9581/g.28851  ORF Transcript_9581/g.28851 Transcript_9581/m.28851 type:complete len:215 (+) Transcript_9581:1454-2098(+)